jgi:hypothetical protein
MPEDMLVFDNCKKMKVSLPLSHFNKQAALTGLRGHMSVKLLRIKHRENPYSLLSRCYMQMDGQTWKS